jgi:DNA-binding response OmpR family regulator
MRDPEVVMYTVGGFAAALPLAIAQSLEAILVDPSPAESDDPSIPARLRQGGWTGPILVLGSRADPASVISALNAGADDYLATPCDVEELCARVRALIRRRTLVDSASQPEPDRE